METKKACKNHESYGNIREMFENFDETLGKYRINTNTHLPIITQGAGGDFKHRDVLLPEFS